MKRVRRYSIVEDLGAVVTYRQRTGTIFDTLRKYKDPSSDVNIFWLWAYQSINADAGIAVNAFERIIIIEDTLHQPERQLAKAFARLFGVNKPNVFQANQRLGQIQPMHEAATQIAGRY